MQEQTTQYYPAVGTDSGPLMAFEDGSLGVDAGPLTAYQDGSLGVSAGPLTAFKDGSLGADTGELQAFRDGSLGALGLLGQTAMTTSPIVAAARALQKRKQHHVYANNGLSGDVNFNTPVAIALGLLFVVGFGALSYQAGKAMAPNKKSASTWGWVGVPVGIATGPIGLGIMGIVSNAETGK